MKVRKGRRECGTIEEDDAADDDAFDCAALDAGDECEEDELLPISWQDLPRGKEEGGGRGGGKGRG
jgi:hypothetical protein